MKLKYFGTAAAEGVPALFCKCDLCQEARKKKGRDIRTRSQSLIDDQLLIDFPADSYLHFLEEDYNLADIEHLIITHGHSDHFYPEDLVMRMSGYSNSLDTKLTIYGNERVASFYQRVFDLEGRMDEVRLAFQLVHPFETFEAGHYHITPLLADHDKKETCLIYQIKDGEKQVLYAHDTGYFLAENWEYWEKTKPYFHCISLDCNSQMNKVDGNHMSFYDNVAIKNKMNAMGLTDEKTIFVSSHFPHNSVLLYDEMNAIGMKEGFIIAYDGLELTF